MPVTRCGGESRAPPAAPYASLRGEGGQSLSHPSLRDGGDVSSEGAWPARPIVVYVCVKLTNMHVRASNGERVRPAGETESSQTSLCCVLLANGVPKKDLNSTFWRYTCGLLNGLLSVVEK